MSDFKAPPTSPRACARKLAYDDTHTCSQFMQASQPIYFFKENETKQNKYNLDSTTVWLRCQITLQSVGELISRFFLIYKTYLLYM